MLEARRARLDMGFGLDGPLPDLLRAIEGPGGAPVAVLRMHDDLAGAYYRLRGDVRLLFVNGAHAAVRQRFTLAHEFGHCRMGHESVIDREADVFGAQQDSSEIAANYFAGEFLMPGQAVRRWARGRRVGLDELVGLAAEYGVSAKMARIRLETAGAVRDRARLERLDAEIDEERLHHGLAGWLGWRELADDLAAASPPRLPPALRDSALGALLAGEIDLSRAAARTGRTADEMRRAIAGLGLDRLVPIG